MNQKRNLLIAGAVVLGLCLCAGVAVVLAGGAGYLGLAKSFKPDPTGIAAVGHRIADFDWPPGYQESFGMSFFGYDVVGLFPEPASSSSTTIMLMQFTSGLTDPATMQQQMERSLAQQNNSA